MIFGKNKSLVCFKANPTAAYRLVCFPCAGSGASMYRRWVELLPEAEVWATNYPGRESMHADGFASEVDQILNPILENTELLKEKPLVIYGHSFGSVIGFLIANQLQANGCSVLGLCVSARRAPHLPPSYRLADLSDQEFLSELDRLGGIPDSIRSNQDMMDFYLPVIKADLQMNDLVVADGAAQVSFPLYLFSAIDDKAASQEELAAWKASTTSRFEHKVFEGGHFFIQDSVTEFMASLRCILASLSQGEDEELIAF